MMPGGRGLNPRQLSQMMKQLGISVEEIDDVQEVIIRTPTKEIVVREPTVSIMDAHGQRTYQVVGEAEERSAEAEGPSEDDIQLVMEGAGVDHDKAVAALEAAGGEPAQAIVDLTEG